MERIRNPRDLYIPTIGDYLVLMDRSSFLVNHIMYLAIPYSDSMKIFPTSFNIILSSMIKQEKYPLTHGLVDMNEAWLTRNILDFEIYICHSFPAMFDIMPVSSVMEYSSNLRLLWQSVEEHLGHRNGPGYESCQPPTIPE